MYGYVRPLKDELKVRQYRDFRAVYCGLCHSLKSVGGFFARFAVSYDFTFLALLAETSCECDKRRCPLSPVRKKSCHRMDEALRFAAQACLIFSYEKTADTLVDEKFFKRLMARSIRFLWRRGYRNSVQALPGLAESMGESMRELRSLERERCAYPDRIAHCFASTLSLLATYMPDAGEEQKRILRELLYALGRFIYFSDALDDFSEDVRDRKYNPIQCRFQTTTELPDEEVREWTRGILTDSINHAVAAFELLSPAPYTEILSNILYLGLPTVLQTVLNRSAGFSAEKTKRRIACEQPL